MSFRTVQYIFLIRDGKIDSVKPLDYLYFVLFFPALSSGPVDRAERFFKESSSTLSRNEYFAFFREGLWKTANGLLYSFVIAPFLNIYFLSRIGDGDPSTVLQYIAYAYVYTLYLFFNFAGYSSLAVGAGCFFGIKMPDNFNFPFVSRDLKEFWTRWHISLSAFFRDFIYNKFVFATLKKKTFKHQHTGSYIGYFLTMFIMGIWHGFDLYFLLYGAYYGILMCVNDILDQRNGFKKFKNSKFGGVVCWAVTMNLVAFGMLLFSGKLLSF